MEQAESKFINKKVWALAIFLIAIAFDQAAKWLALKILPSNGIFILSKYFFGLKVLFNKGIAFSINLSGILLYVLIIILMVFIISKYREEFAKPISNLLYSLAFLFAGAIGNFIDRLARHGVVDFINFGPWVFNFADVFVIIGLAGLLMKEFGRESRKTGK